MADVTTDWGFLLVLVVMLPIGGVLLALLLGGRRAERAAMTLLPVGLGVALAIAAVIIHSGRTIGYGLGGWTPPLGVALRADGLSVVMLVTTALLVCGIALFARTDFQTREAATEQRAPLAFWVLLLALWGALNAVFIGRDLFNLYVMLELLTFGAVPLVCLDGRAATLTAALRYLLFALVGSVLYLLGNALLYGTYGTIDIVLLSGRVHGETSAWVGCLQRLPCFHCIFGCRRPMRGLRRPPARYYPRWS
jgi:formate hydrogenlyase subunit 3/multisubunit Na+/H+ antiporter MnhD subunit